MANDTEFGLAAYIFTNNTSRLFRVSEALEYGMVSANTGIFSSEVGPFGGVKSSGLGREGSKYGIDEFLEIKFVCVGTLIRHPSMSASRRAKSPAFPGFFNVL